MKLLLNLSVFIITITGFGQVAKENVSAVSSATLEELVTVLASDDLSGRNTGSPGIAEAATYIEKKFITMGVLPYFESYRDEFLAKGNDAFNVIGFIEGNDPELKNEIVILGAHYDHIGKGRTVNGDSIANGANDNAAGTSAVMAIAEYFSKTKSNKRSLMFALFSAEEMGLLGSKHLATRLKNEGLNLYTMLNFEMIGVPMKDKDYDMYLSGYELSNMGEKLNEYVGFKLIGLLPKAKEFSLFKRSDNYPFYKEFKLPCQTVSTFDFTNYEYYHHVDDEVEFMDFNHMAELVNKVIPAIEKMTSTTDKEIVMYE